MNTEHVVIDFRIPSGAQIGDKFSIPVDWGAIVLEVVGIENGAYVINWRHEPPCG